MIRSRMLRNLKRLCVATPLTAFFTASLTSLTGCDLSSAPNPAATEQKLFEVPAGASARGLGPDLQKQGLINDSWRWEWFLRTETSGAQEGGKCLKAGRHNVSAAMDAAALLTALCGAPVPNDEPFTLVEGWRILEIDAALAAKGWVQAGAFTTAVTTDLGSYKTNYPLPTDTLEGFLYPETYKVEPESFKAEGGLHAFVQRLLDMFGERFGNEAVAKGLPTGPNARSFHDLVVMASMIEREEPNPANRTIIAGILWKRIDAGWNLGVDATSRYTLPDWNNRAAFMGKLRDPKDPWNTRLRAGLPPTPIGNPGAVALHAAMNPEASEYWYYLHDSSQTLHGGRNVGEHEANRRKFNVY